MRLWILEPTGASLGLWAVEGLRPCRLVIRAETEGRARALAQAVGDEFTLEEVARKQAWINPAHSTCIEACSAGAEGVLLECLESWS